MTEKENPVQNRQSWGWMRLLAVVGVLSVLAGVFGAGFGFVSRLPASSNTNSGAESRTPTSTPNLALLPTDQQEVWGYWAHRVPCPSDAPRLDDGSGPNVCLRGAIFIGQELAARPTPQSTPQGTGQGTGPGATATPSSVP